jgi:2-polyprenyl-3-methyl-5-hydroxy-6-metoxy-1,4-benzoquinol methylase
MSAEPVVAEPSAESGRVRHQYALDNKGAYAKGHHLALTELLDPVSRSRTLELVDGDLAGLSCLDVGAGGGGYAIWLTGQVGPTGHVTAVDLNPEPIPEHEGLTVYARDLRKYEAIPGGPFDFVHARLTLGHIPERQEILHWLLSDEILRPGGVALIEDWDASRTDMVLSAPTPAAKELYDKFQATLGDKVFAGSGTDRTWARRAHGRMVAEGMVDVRTTITSESWRGGTAGALLCLSSLNQTRPKLLQFGLTEDELQEVDRLMHDPQMVLAGHLLYSNSCRKPA